MRSRFVTTLNENGRDICYVPLGRGGDLCAVIWKEDFDFLIRLGITANWTKGGSNYVTCNSSKVPGNKLQVVRVLLNAGPGEKVRYLDGNSYNLRRENLIVVPSSYAKRRDRDFIPGPKAFEVAA